MTFNFQSSCLHLHSAEVTTWCHRGQLYSASSGTQGLVHARQTNILPTEVFLGLFGEWVGELRYDLIMWPRVASNSFLLAFQVLGIWVLDTTPALKMNFLEVIVQSATV